MLSTALCVYTRNVVVLIYKGGSNENSKIEKKNFLFMPLTKQPFTFQQSTWPGMPTITKHSTKTILLPYK
jgi:hypothetical protein